MATRQTPWGSRPSDWELAPWSAFAARSGRPVVVEPDANLKQVTVRVRHQGVTERRLNKNRPRRIGTPNQVQVSAGHFVMSKIDARNGACGFIPEHLDGAIVTHDFPVYDIHAADPRYLDHLVDLPVFWRLCESVSDGTTNRVRLDLEQFDDLRFPMPPLAEQRGIAAVLDAIDEAIERSEAVVAATEELRRSLLHELLSRGVPGRHSEWRDVRGLGVVPACWEVVRLGEVCERPEYGAGAPARPFDPALPRYVRITDITDDGRLRPDDARSADPSEVDGYELGPGDLLFARSGATVGKTHLHRQSDGPCVYAGYLIRFRALSDAALPEFLDLWTRSDFYRRWVASMLRAGAQPNINATEYSSLPVALPPLEEQQRIADAHDGVGATLEESRMGTDVLRSVKASASEALLSGRVRVARS